MSKSPKPVPLRDAAMRILCAWVDSCIHEPGYELRCPLRETLTHEAVAWVSRFNLLTEYADFERRRELLDKHSDYDEQRGRRMIEARLMTPMSGRVQ
jgi:hypothetical protein